VAKEGCAKLPPTDRLGVCGKRLVAALVPLAALVSACAVGVPQPPTSPSPFDNSIVLNAKVASSIDGPTDYWFRYGERGDQPNWSDTPHETVELTEGEAAPVSEQLTGLQPSHRYGWQVCVADRGEDPPRVVCSTERKFGTVGDIVMSVNGSPFDAVSGPDGQNPGGDVSGAAVTCLRVQGSEVAVVGTDGGVWHLKRIEGTSLEIFGVEFVAWPAGSDHTICPQPKQPEGSNVANRLFIQDAP
jgi:hypothetical protein